MDREENDDKNANQYQGMVRFFANRTNELIPSSIWVFKKAWRFQIQHPGVLAQREVEKGRSPLV
jgi:hypothetical protein